MFGLDGDSSTRLIVFYVRDSLVKGELHICLPNWTLLPTVRSIRDEDGRAWFTVNSPLLARPASDEAASQYAKNESCLRARPSGICDDVSSGVPFARNIVSIAAGA